MKIQKYVGLDVHKDKTTVAIAEGDRTGEVRAYGEISSNLVTTEKALRKIKGEQGVLHVAQEAGGEGAAGGGGNLAGGLLPNRDPVLPS